MKDILRSLRIENNYSQSAVASYLEISRQMYNKYEIGNAEPSLKIIKKLCELYKVSADVFLNSDKLSKNENNSYEQYNYNYSDMYVSSPKAIYGTSFADKNNNDNLLAELINLLPLLQLNEQILLLQSTVSIFQAFLHMIVFVDIANLYRDIFSLQRKAYHHFDFHPLIKAYACLFRYIALGIRFRE